MHLFNHTQTILLFQICLQRPLDNVDYRKVQKIRKRRKIVFQSKSDHQRMSIYACMTLILLYDLAAVTLTLTRWPW